MLVFSREGIASEVHLTTRDAIDDSRSSIELRADGSDELGVGFRPLVEVYVGGTDGESGVVDAVGNADGGHGGF